MIDEAYFPDETRNYYARLTVTNLDNDETSQATDELRSERTARSTPTSAWVPASPAVGQAVIFHISGAVAVDSTSVGLRPFRLLPLHPDHDLHPGPRFVDCLEQTFSYAQSGTNIPVRSR